jgi:predicted nucleic acid-binding protein
MILLDTNVVSEAMKPEPHPSVRDWLDAQAAETLFLSSVTIAELLFGIGALPRGKRKDRLTAVLDGVLDLFAARILPFDTAAARRYADLAVKARAAGKGFPTPMAISQRSPPRTGSPWHRATRVRSTPPV